MSQLFKATGNKNATPLSLEETTNKVYDAVDKFLKDAAERIADHLGKLDLKYHSTEFNMAANILIDNDLIYLPGTDRQTSVVHIEPKGLAVIELGGIRNYLKRIGDKSIQAAETAKMQNELLKWQLAGKEKDEKIKDLQEINLTEHNKYLESENSNRLLKKDLLDSQYQVSELQRNELKNKTKWAILGAIGGAILGFFTEYAGSALLHK